MKGIVIEQGQVCKGKIQEVKKQNRQKKTQNLNPYFYDQSESIQTINIPDNALLTGSGYNKFEHGYAKTDTILLTTRHFGDLPLYAIKKLKIYRKCQVSDHHTIKVQGENQERIWYLPLEYAFTFSYLGLWAKLNSMGINVDQTEQFINTCEGEVFKKSEIIGVWQPRYLVITANDGLMSFKNRDEAPTLRIQNTEELWTRFELVEDRQYIVFKLWYSILKQQFAVPLNRSVKWFKAFYSLLTR